MQHGTIIERGSAREQFPASEDEASEFRFLFDRGRTDLPNADALNALVANMLEPEGLRPGTPEDNEFNSIQPAGFTFFGQFVDHDITLNADNRDPDAQIIFGLDHVHNGRTPRLDLDSVFGGGPFSSGSADLYDQTTLRLKLADSGFGPVAEERTDGTVRHIVADPRNSENIIILQLHTVFMRLYNWFMDGIPGPNDEAKYLEARRLTVLHYQQVVLNDYLPRVIGRTAIEDALDRKANIFRAMANRAGARLVMPVEFAFAAFRFGHTQVRSGYLVNTHGAPRAIFSGSGPDLNGNIPLSNDVVIDWNLFFEISETEGAVHTGPRMVSRRFDTKLAQPLKELERPGIDEPARAMFRNLAVRNLFRGRSAGVLSGQAIAAATRITPLTRDELGIHQTIQDETLLKQLEENTPLWFYILREAQVRGGGTRLDGVGSWLLAETFVGLLINDEHSVLNNGFTPQFGLETMAGICRTVWPNAGRGHIPAV